MKGEDWTKFSWTSRLRLSPPPLFLLSLPSETCHSSDQKREDTVRMSFVISLFMGDLVFFACLQINDPISERTSGACGSPGECT